MNMQAMLMQAQKMQKELQKAQNELAKKEFEIKKSNVITLVMYGDRSVKSLHIEKGVFESENSDMIEEMIVVAFNEALHQIDEEVEAINVKITGRPGGLGF